MRLCDKCGKAKGARRVTLSVDAGIDWKSEIVLELCDDCAASFYREADKFIADIGKKFAEFKASLSLIEPGRGEGRGKGIGGLLEELSKKWKTSVRGIV